MKIKEQIAAFICPTCRTDLNNQWCCYQCMEDWEGILTDGDDDE